MQGYTFEAAYNEIKRKRVQCILLSDAQKQFVRAYSAGNIEHSVTPV
jgi:hypothetical protein